MKFYTIIRSSYIVSIMINSLVKLQVQATIKTVLLECLTVILNWNSAIDFFILDRI